MFASGSWIPITSQNAAQYPEAMSKCGNAVLPRWGEYSRHLHRTVRILSYPVCAVGEYRCVFHRICRSSIPDASARWKACDRGWEPGFIINSDGTSEFVGTVIRNADLSETRIERLDADVLHRQRGTYRRIIQRLVVLHPYWDMGTVMGTSSPWSQPTRLCTRAARSWPPRWKGLCIHRLRERAVVTSSGERDQDRSLLKPAVTTANAGTAFTSLPCLLTPSPTSLEESTTLRKSPPQVLRLQAEAVLARWRGHLDRLREPHLDHATVGQDRQGTPSAQRHLLTQAAARRRVSGISSTSRATPPGMETAGW